MPLLEVLGLMMMLAASPDPLTQIDEGLPARVGAWERDGAATVYDRESIFSYIDGHGEVYRAYGMRRCLAQRYARAEAKDAGGLILDVFEMETSDGAFGVFTHDQDGEMVDLGHDGLIRSGWLSFWKGRLFVSLYAEEDSPAAREALVRLGEQVASAIHEKAERPRLIARLPEGWLPGTRHFFFDSQILRYHVPGIPSGLPLELTADTPAALARYERDGVKVRVLLVEHVDASAAAAAHARLNDADLGDSELGHVGIRVIGRFLVLAMHAASASQAETVLDEVRAGLS